MNNDHDFSNIFSDALNATSLIGEEIPLSTAVHMSARFTYLSPAGTIQRLDQDNAHKDSWIHVVDGGYFENSGAVTADEILTQVMATQNGEKVSPNIIHISNEPVKKEADHFHQHVLFGEVISPLLAIFNVRPARGFQARERLEHRVNRKTGKHHFHFKLCESNTRISLPLGWMLSDKAQAEMNAQLDGIRTKGKTDCDAENRENINAILDLL